MKPILFFIVSTNKKNTMTKILPIPSKMEQVQKVLSAANIKLSDMIKIKTATLKTIVGCLNEEKSLKVSAAR